MFWAQLNLMGKNQEKGLRPKCIYQESSQFAEKARVTQPHLFYCRYPLRKSAIFLEACSKTSTRGR